MSDKDYIKTLEKSNESLNVEIDRLRRMLSAHGINPDKELDRVTQEAYNSGYENHYNKYINYQIQIEKQRKLEKQVSDSVLKDINKKIMEDIWGLVNSKPSPYTYTPQPEDEEP